MCLAFDILDPEVLPAGVPAHGGLSFDDLHALLTEPAGEAQLLGVRDDGLRGAGQPRRARPPH